MRETKSGLTAMAMAVVMTASACGGGSEPQASEATVAESTTTSTPPETTEAPATTAAPTTTAETTTTTTTEPPPTELELPLPENTGTGVTVVILDRGIDYDHPDFLNPDGTTRIKGILDMSGQSYCTGSRASVEYTEEQINAALSSGEPLGTDDYQGHGTATAGAAAGNGSALEGTPYRAPASTADLLIVKATTEGAPATSAGPGEPRTDGCGTDALAWVDEKITELGQPAVALWNIGVQWGPIDGTSQLSREIAAVFGPDRPGRVWVVSSGDEGSLPNHAGGAYAPGAPLEIPFVVEADRPASPTGWLSGDAPASVTIEFDDGPTIGPLSPGAFVDQDGVQAVYYQPGEEFYPLTSTSGDHAFGMVIDGPAGAGTIRFESLGGEGYVDLYGDTQGSEFLTSAIEFEDHLVPGRLTDLAATDGAVVVGVHVEREIFEGADGEDYDLSAEGVLGDLWLKSSDGPTRDGRDVLDVTAPGQNAPAALGQNSSWAALQGNILRDSDGWYVRFGGTSGAGPIVVGTVALMLEVNPDLTASEVKQILRETATVDEFTGDVPNDQWGWGKLDIVAAVEAAAAAG